MIEGVTRRVPKELAVTAARLALLAIGAIFAGRILLTGPIGHVVARDIDTPIRNFVTRPRDPAWHDALAHVSALGTAGVTGAVAAVAAVVCSLRTRRPTAALQLAAAFGGAALLTIVVKFGVNRQPASGPIGRFAAGTFPSGHTLFAVSVYGTIVLMVVRSGARRGLSRALAALVAVLVIAIGASRVYLLDHYLSDVVASLVLGAAWVAIVGSSATTRAT